MNDTAKIKEFWDNQAIEFGKSDLATAPDHAYRGLEIERIIPHIIGKRVLDVGCGNGYSTFCFQEAYPDKTFFGVDYSQEMINAAIAENINRHTHILFYTRDVMELSKDAALPFDTIISERCLIDLKTWDEQKHALLEMKKCLAPGGIIILVENFVDGLGKLNQLRHKFGLHPIQVRWHNRYLLNSEFCDFHNEHFLTTYHENIGNLYYIISRVVYATMCKDLGLGEPRYEHPINFIAARLPSLGSYYAYSPNMLYVMRAK